ncbi:unnamed protein product [Paramecium sonneborni]|uniref:Uncharacterized protein n=1 Tax=Paramecium sonneborni TaxID=65129 RepID=A0A8S1NUI0_9CILI|nr:unnamed protein product [Paramecium sonneborni]
MQRAKQNIIRLEAIHSNRQKILTDQNEKLEKLNKKISNSIEASQQKKDEKLSALQNKLKTLNKRRQPRQMSFQEVIDETEVQSPSNKHEIKQKQISKSVQKQEIHVNITPRIKVAQPNNKLNQSQLFDQLNKSIDAAKQRKSQRLNCIKQKLHDQDEIVHQHLEKSQKNKEEVEQQRLNQIYEKLLFLTKRSEVKQAKIKSKERKKSIKIQLSNSESQKIYKIQKYEEQKTESARTAQSINNDYKIRQVRKRLESLNNKREIQAQNILDKHRQFSNRNQQNKQLLDELANTCQYYNFKIKEQYLL